MQTSVDLVAVSFCSTGSIYASAAASTVLACLFMRPEVWKHDASFTKFATLVHLRTTMNLVRRGRVSTSLALIPMNPVIVIPISVTCIT